ncbi:receptor-like protein 12 isoform X2 [Arabidopsis lyrata subsp. lyrata]|uniref:receptor-like protein 12 isoform X2 n=1 Tax=Arabidopsis lyrata subsp. lyrata TaxID=81972 RepID=UPI000A29AF1A|nr:receptor-like protein 12 isoform X2 [Arabidopsis lyrata subsp. lyrata]|eukprot:XP_020870599.1 receptor-like protein 12 isoform X2 [Arabidopsis lyrata subsp. lyrata]
MEGSWNSVSIILLSLSFLVFNSTFLGAYGAPSGHLCRQDQRDALLELKNGFQQSFRPFRDLRWSTTYWKKEGDCCSWDGITCDSKSGEVIGLDLGVNSLEGEINSSSSLFKLHNLRALNLAYNDFKSSFLSIQYTTFTELTLLNLSHSNFSGKIPVELLQLTKLVSLDLSSNSLSAEKSFLDNLFRNLTTLKELSLGSVDISSEIPENITNLSYLKSLYLDDCNLIGGFPSRVLLIPTIKSLSLSGNNKMEGPLPKFHGNNSLEVLDLSSTSFSGNIPNSIGNLKHLNVLKLDYCNFSGLIPSSLGNLSGLTFVSLSGNNFVGEIPSSFGSLKQLTTLIVESNKLSGEFPLQLLNLTKLSSLSLAYNQFTSTLPPNMSSLSNLENFDARQNSFVGYIPFTLFTIPSLRVIYLSDNQLNGTLGFSNMSSPSHLNNSSLSGLYLSNNRITGQVPSWLWSLPNLITVDLSNNSFSGFDGFTKDISTSKISVLDLRSNDFQGPLFVPRWPITDLLASGNNFSGEIPISICDMTSLDILDVGNNNLNGSVPECLRKLMERSISVLDLGDNHLGGNLPDIFMNASNMRSLNVGHNNFVGKLPRSLIGCSSLEVLNVEHNGLNDTFPFWLHLLKKLQVLVLRSNEFHGSLQHHFQGHFWFTQLRIIDISHNDFTGTLASDFFIYWSAMSSKGDRPKWKYIGGNRLHGKIPESVGLLKDLIVLNLSRNSFTGNIPSSLASLTQLESLDLSHNKLSGQIPSALRDLTTLSFIKFSHNKLIGPIPQSTQFQTQSASSFEENIGLCGPPLDKNCGGVNTQPSQQPETGEEEEEGVLNWTAAAIGLAPGVIFGITIGHIVITLRRLQWLMKISGVTKPRCQGSR